MSSNETCTYWTQRTPVCADWTNSMSLICTPSGLSTFSYHNYSSNTMPPPPNGAIFSMLALTRMDSIGLGNMIPKDSWVWGQKGQCNYRVMQENLPIIHRLGQPLGSHSRSSGTLQGRDWSFPGNCILPSSLRLEDHKRLLVQACYISGHSFSATTNMAVSSFRFNFVGQVVYDFFHNNALVIKYNLKSEELTTLIL